MPTKYSVRVISQGRLQKNLQIEGGGGLSGSGLEIPGSEGARFQIVDSITYLSPKKLQLKRVGNNLQIALPGGDILNPDIVIKDYFVYKDQIVSGVSEAGESVPYDTASTNFGISSLNASPISVMEAGTVSAASLSRASSESWYSGIGGLAAAAGGLALVSAATGSSGSGGSSGTASAASLAKISTYKSDPTKAVPLVSDFSNAGVSGVTAANVTSVLTFIPKTQLSLDSASGIQTLVDSIKIVMNEANGSQADATPNADPTAKDYENLLGSAIPASLSSKPNALSLMNDRLKMLNSTDADTYQEIKDLADAVDAIALLAQAEKSTNGTPAATGVITAAQLSKLGIDLKSGNADGYVVANLAMYSDAIRASADDMSAVASVEQLKKIIFSYNTILAEANGTAADTTQANPTAADYAAIGADIGTAKSDADALLRLNAIVGNLTSAGVDTVDEISKLAATLDKIQTVAALQTGVVLTDAQKFSVDELKNLGLLGFTGSDVQNTALALKVSEAIRDRTNAEVSAGVFTMGKLDTGATPNTLIDWNQTQLERLQTLVSQEIVKNYVIDNVMPANSTIAPTLTDWQNIGVFKPNVLRDTVVNSAAQGYSVLTSTELAYLNSAADKLPASALSNRSQAQAVLEAYLRIIQEANGSASDQNPSVNPNAADLALVGVTGDAADSGKQASSLMLDVISNLASTGVDTVAKLQALANTVTKLMVEAAATTATGSFTVAELSNLGLRGASATGSSSNVVDFLQHVRDDTASVEDINSLAKLQSFMSLSVVQAWARDVNPDSTATPNIVKTAITPTVQDYKDIGVVRQVPKNAADGSAGAVPAYMSQADLAAVNDAIDTLVNASNADVTNKIANKQAVIDIATSYFKILNEANGNASDYINGYTVHTTDGSASTSGYLNNDSTTSDVTAFDLNPNPTATDYINIGIGGAFTNNRTSLLNTVVAEKNFSQVDTVKEIQILADSVDKVLSLAGGSGDLTLSQFSSDLGLFGVNAANLADVNSIIRAQTNDSNVDSFAELQSLISLTRIQRFADSSITGAGATNEGGALPTYATGNYTDDWKNLLGVTGEQSVNYSAYNSAVEANTKATLPNIDAVNNLVISYNKILAEANGPGVADATPGVNPSTNDYLHIGLDLSALWGSSFVFTDPVGSGALKGDVALKLLNESVGQLTTSAVSSVPQLANLATTVGYLVNLASKPNTATPQADPNVNPTNAPTYDSSASPVAIPGTFASDLAAMGLVGASKLGDTSYRYNGSNYNAYERENVWAAIQNTDVGAGSNTLLSYAAIQAIVDKYAY